MVIFGIRPEDESAGAVHDFDAGRNDQGVAQARVCAQQARLHRAVTRIHKGGRIVVDRLEERVVEQPARGLIVNAEAFDEDRRRARNVARQRADGHVVADARGAEVQRALELAAESARRGGGVRAGLKRIHAEIERCPGFQIERRAQVGDAIDCCPGFEADRAALAGRVEVLGVGGEPGAGFHRE